MQLHFQSSQHCTELIRLGECMLIAVLNVKTPSYFEEECVVSGHWKMTHCYGIAFPSFIEASLPLRQLFREAYTPRFRIIDTFQCIAFMTSCHEPFHKSHWDYPSIPSFFKRGFKPSRVSLRCTPWAGGDPFCSKFWILLLWPIFMSEPLQCTLAWCDFS